VKPAFHPTADPGRQIQVARLPRRFVPWLSSPFGVLAPAVLLWAAWLGSARAAEDPVAVLAAEVRHLGWIAYGARSTNGDWDLFLCRPDGSSVRPLTQTPRWSEFSPQFSSDGRKLLYRRVPPSEQLDNNRHGEQGELVLAGAEGNDPVVLGKPGELSWASFSPDGRQIASLSVKGIAFFDLERRVVTRTLPRKGFFQQMTWSPDGKWLCGVANSFGASWSIARMDVATGEASAVNTVDCCTPDWFPDSASLIFSWRPRGQKANKGYGWTQLWRATANGAARELVYAEEGRHVYGGHISPDGKYVLFTGNVEEDGDPGRAGAPMALMRLSDGPTIRGESKEFRALHPNTKDGPVLSLPAGWEPCWTAKLAGARAESTAGEDSSFAGAKADLRSELRGQGTIVFSDRTDAGDWDLFLMTPDGGARRRVTSTREFNEAGARFSPDGRRLLCYRMPKSEPVDNNTYGTFELVLANADGTGPVVYGRGFDWASWSPDGRQLACLAPGGIRFIEVETRAVVRKLPRQGIVSQLVWSPDGRHLAGTANHLGQFWNIGCLSVDTGSITAISETERYNCTPDWMPDSRRVVYARGIVPQQPGHAELWVANIDGTGRYRVYAEAGRHIYGACPSPSGKHVLFTRSIQDLGVVPDIEMAVVRLADRPETETNPCARLDLGPGWEPHWTAAVIRQ